MIGTLEELREDMRKGVYDFTVNGECSQCGNCCGRYLPLSSKEIKEIHRYIKKHHILEQKHNYPISSPGVLDVTCPFLDETKEKEKCTCYQVRPGICREFKCDYPRRKIMLNKEKFHHRYGVVDMREEFFGGDEA